MIKPGLLLCALAALAACVPGATPPPSTAAVPVSAPVDILPVSFGDRTKVDEQSALAVTLAYTAAARSAALAIRVGLIKDPATIRRIGDLDRRAYAAVVSVEQAYRTANAATIAAAIGSARLSIEALLRASSGS